MARDNHLVKTKAIGTGTGTGIVPRDKALVSRTRISAELLLAMTATAIRVRTGITLKIKTDPKADKIKATVMAGKTRATVMATAPAAAKAIIKTEAVNLSPKVSRDRTVEATGAVSSDRTALK